MNTKTVPAPGLTRNGPPPTDPPAEIKPTEAVAAIADAATDVVSDAQKLVEDHGTLFKAEMREVCQQAAAAGVTTAVASLTAAIGLFFLFVGLVKLTLWANPTMAEWVAWLLWGGGLAVAGGAVAVLLGRSLTRLDFFPHRTLRSLLESWSWLTNRRK
jgi:hypothetical protein